MIKETSSRFSFLECHIFQLIWFSIYASVGVEVSRFDTISSELEKFKSSFARILSKMIKPEGTNKKKLPKTKKVRKTGRCQKQKGINCKKVP